MGARDACFCACRQIQLELETTVFVDRAWKARSKGHRIYFLLSYGGKFKGTPSPRFDHPRYRIFWLQGTYEVISPRHAGVVNPPPSPAHLFPNYRTSDHAFGLRPFTRSRYIIPRLPKFT
jgi:hypothetical protein